GRGALPAALACVAIAVALTGPAVERPGAQNFRNLDVTVVVVDLSRSVAMSPRFMDARLAAYAAVEATGSRQAAVIVYAGDAYLAAPLTSDHRALETLMSSLDGDTVPDVGTAPTAALALARATLKQAGAIGGDVVLVSDGGGLDDSAETEARALAAEGHALSTLYVEPAPQAPKRTGVDGRAA
ncbi:VWA domain-containing protein, partial [Methylopila musalis]